MAAKKKNVSKKRRYFKVWLDKNLVTGGGRTVEIVEVTPGQDADEACRDLLDVLIGNELDTGYDEVTKEEAEKIRKEGED